LYSAVLMGTPDWNTQFYCVRSECPYFTHEPPFLCPP
jgi:hypothetical protein